MKLVFGMSSFKMTLFHDIDGFRLLFDELQRGISKGQFAAWYIDDELIGSGVIQ